MSQPQVKREPGIKLEPDTGSPATGSGSPQMSPAPKLEAPGEWNVIPLKACSREELKDTRNHIMRFQTKQDVDIVKNFNKPVRLHRKDPQNIQFHLSREEMDKRRKEGTTTEVTNTTTYMDEEGNIIAPPDMSQVAPDGGARRHRRNLFKRKTKQVHMMDEKKRKLRYEEYYPWVIEDYNGTNVYVGSYEAGLSETSHVLFVFDKDGFKMVPAEKVYKFTPRNRYATLTLEEAEAKMEKNQAAPRWLMKHMDEEGNDARFRTSGQFSQPVRPLELSQSSSGSRYRMRTVQGGSTSNERDSDHDDLDFEEEFADDEEAPIMDGDEEENKLSEKKIKKEMLKAATFEGQLDADDSDDLNDLFEVEKSRKVDKEGKKLKKVLNKTEGGVYDSDENEQLNPYVSQSDLESEDDSDPEVNIKAEPNDDVAGEDLLRPRSFYVSSANNGFVVIRAPKQFLQGFQHGEWNPNAKKRPQTFEAPSPTKKARREEASPSTSPVPENSNAGDLNNAGPNGELVTTGEVLDIVRNNPLTTKELLLRLKTRISTHKDNKLRIITIVKLNLKLIDGKLVLKEE